MPEHGVRSNFSQAPFQILMTDDEGVISSGTGFFYDHNGETFILTNWHNISGLDPWTGASLGKSARRPLKVIAKLARWVNEGRGEFGILPTAIDIYSPCRQNTLWIEHPRLGRTCDIVAIPYIKTDSIPPFMHVHANRISSIKIPVRPGLPVFVIGFPRSLASGFGLPLWKSGFIASEPHYDVTIGGKLSVFGGLEGGTNIPAFFIDSLTRSGMSGSPVFSSFTGNWDMSNPYDEIDPRAANFWDRDDIALGENRMEFVGIYSARVPSEEREAALGLCWKKDAIEEICAHGVSGAHPHL